MMGTGVSDIDPEHGPTVFISHSECDDTFCHELYDALLRHGVRPIMDKRDFQPGDDLVRRVFDQGIGEASVVVFVLSAGSVDRPWLRKELSVSVVHEIAQRVRIIPLLLDLPDNDVPPALAATIWIRIDPHVSVDEAARRISNAAYGRTLVNPVVAPAPAWTREAVARIPGLEAFDIIVLRIIVEQALRDFDPLVHVADIIGHEALRDVNESELEAVLAQLTRAGYLGEGLHGRGTTIPFAVRPSTFGVSSYLEAYRADEYAQAFDRAVGAIMNQGVLDLDKLVEIVGAPQAIVAHIIDVLHAAGDILAMPAFGSVVKWSVKPTLRRRLR